jgi:hypothetical protein
MNSDDEGTTLVAAEEAYLRCLATAAYINIIHKPIFLSVVGAIAKAKDAPVLSSVILELISPSQRRLFYF